jgi:hypothetical protein
MGADYYSKSFIGQKVDEEKLRIPVVKAGCSHKNGPKVKFCPECGNKAWITVNESEIDLEDLAEKSGLELIYSTNSDETFLAFPEHYAKSGSSNCGEELDFKPLSDNAVKDAKDALKTILEPLKLWNEADFGLWTILYCSY